MTESQLSSEDYANSENHKSINERKMWLCNQIFEYKSALIAIEKSQKPDTEDTEDPEKLLEQITKLQKEIKTKNSNNELKKAIIECLSVGSSVNKIIFPALLSEKTEDKEHVSDGELEQDVLNLIEKQSALTTEISDHYDAILNILPSINNLKKESLRLTQQSRELMTNLQVQLDQNHHVSSSKRNKKVEWAMQDLEELTSKIDVVRKVIQRLIIGSGTDWCSDPMLSDLMVELGKPIHAVL